MAELGIYMYTIFRLHCSSNFCCLSHGGIAFTLVVSFHFFMLYDADYHVFLLKFVSFFRLVYFDTAPDPGPQSKI